MSSNNGINWGESQSEVSGIDTDVLAKAKEYTDRDFSMVLEPFIEMLEKAGISVPDEVVDDIAEEIYNNKYSYLRSKKDQETTLKSSGRAYVRKRKSK